MKSSKELLISKGVKPTFQRLKIYKYLHDNKKHPTVDEIYRVLVKDIPTMSKTTVYNTLNMLVKKGLISAVNITGTEVRFDGEMTGHHHFLCEKCGRVIDIAIECPVCNEKEIQGHKITELHGYFKGVCGSCRKKND
jgi:Fur family peroxide stress response transcriptional regulator